MKHEVSPLFGNGNRRLLHRCLAVAASAFVLAMAGGCGPLTRVDQATHVRQVDSFRLMGLHHDEAVRRIEAAGFTCSPYKDKEPFLWSLGKDVPVFRRICSKASFEMFCPQRRYVTFHYTPEQRVVHVEHPPRFEEQSCF